MRKGPVDLTSDTLTPDRRIAMKLAHPRLLLAASLASLAIPALAGNDTAPTAPRTETSRVAKVVIRESGDLASPVPGQSIMIKSRKVDGQPDKTELAVVGKSGTTETFDVDDLQVGDSASFDTADGKTIQVKRTDAGLVLDVDGKTIALPGDMDAALPEGLGSGAHQVRVVKVVSSSSGDGQTVDVMPMGGLATALTHVDFDSLDSLKGLDASTREKVIAALHEILSKQAHVMVVNVDTDTVAPAAPVPPVPPSLPSRRSAHRVQ